MQISRLSILALACLLAAGCQPAASPDADGDTAAAPESAVDATATPEPEAPVAVQVVRVEPDAMLNCADPAAVTVHWDARDAGGSNVDIFLVDRRGNEKLFFTGGPTGSRESGPWMRSETQVILRDHNDGRELGRARISGSPCVEDAQPDAG